MIWTLRPLGQPAPKGSFDIMPRGAKPLRLRGESYWRVRDMVLIPGNSDKLARWKHSVELAALEAGWPKRPPAGVAVAIEATFYLHRPQHPDHLEPIGRVGDTDKLIRAIGDFLQGRYWVDDSQITEWRARKTYATEQEPEGARIVIEALDGGQRTLDL